MTYFCSDKQIEYILHLQKQLHISPKQFARELNASYGRTDLDGFLKEEASDLIERLTAMRDGHAALPPLDGQLSLFDEEAGR